MSGHHDIIIVGGGMVGSALACALAPAGLRIAVLERSRADATPTRLWDNRVSAVTRASQKILDALGVWPHMVAARVSPFREMEVWDASGNGRIHFDSAEIGEDTLGHIVENRVIVAALQKRLTTWPNVDVIAPALPRSMSRDDTQVTLELQDGNTLHAKLIVGADGARSWVREQSGIAVSGTDYQQTAVVATVKTRAWHQETAWQRFLPDGPLAFLPLSDGYSSIVWSTSPAHAAELLTLDDAAFGATLAQAFGQRLGDITECGPRAAFPLRSQHAERYIDSRLALIGDAAHTIHPLAGQGVNLGFADAAALAEVLLAGQAQHRDLGSVSLLRRYERWRRGENLLMLNAMTGFKQLFGSTAPTARWARNLGLSLTDRMGPLKNLIIRHAMGLKGDLSALARYDRA